MKGLSPPPKLDGVNYVTISPPQSLVRNYIIVICFRQLTEGTGDEARAEVRWQEGVLTHPSTFLTLSENICITSENIRITDNIDLNLAISITNR